MYILVKRIYVGIILNYNKSIPNKKRLFMESYY